MKKKSLSLLAATGLLAAAGMAQADVVFYPDGTSVELGENGAETLLLSSSDPVIDTTILGAAPATTTTVTRTEYVYVQPNINFDRHVALQQWRSNPHLVRGHASLDKETRHQAAATFDVPARAGEFSTMTNGVPNMSTSNQSMVVGSYTIPHHVVSVDGPYYVFSY